MKFVLALLFLAGLAFADPNDAGPNPNAEADPAAWYGGYYGYGRPYYGGYYGGYYGHRYGYGLWGRKKREADPAVVATTYSAPAVVPHLGYALGAPYLHHAVPHTYTVAHKDAVVTPGKVEVTQAAPSIVYAGHYGYGLPYAHWGYGLPVLAKPAEEAAAVDARKKREAESDPEAWYYGHYGYGHLGYGYGGYYGYPYYGYGYYG